MREYKIVLRNNQVRMVKAPSFFMAVSISSCLGWDVVSVVINY